MRKKKIIKPGIIFKGSLLNLNKSTYRKDIVLSKFVLSDKREEKTSDYEGGTMWDYYFCFDFDVVEYRFPVSKTVFESTAIGAEFYLLLKVLANEEYCRNYKIKKIFRCDLWEISPEMTVYAKDRRDVIEQEKIAFEKYKKRFEIKYGIPYDDIKNR